MDVVLCVWTGQAVFETRIRCSGDEQATRAIYALAVLDLARRGLDDPSVESWQVRLEDGEAALASAGASLGRR